MGMWAHLSRKLSMLVLILSPAHLVLNEQTAKHYGGDELEYFVVCTHSTVNADTMFRKQFITL